MKPVILFDNVFEQGTVTASSEDTANGYNKENAYDGLTYDFWRPVSAGTHYLTADMGAGNEHTVDTLGIAAHDLGTNGALVSVEYSNDNFLADINAVTFKQGNLFAYSEDLKNAVWENSWGGAAAIVRNWQNANNHPPFAMDGLGHADKLLSNAGYSGISQLLVQTLKANISYVISAWVAQSQGGVDTNTFSFRLDIDKVAGGELFAEGHTLTTDGSFKRYQSVYTPTSNQPTVYAGITGVNLGEAGILIFGMQFEEAAKAGPYVKKTTQLGAPDADKTFVAHFEPVWARYWRIKVVSPTAASKIGAVILGKALVMPEGLRVGYSNLWQARNDNILNQSSQTGAFLGRSVRSQGLKGQFNFDVLDRAFVAGSWNEFLTHARSRPFFFARDPVYAPEDVAYCWTDGTIAPPSFMQPGYQRQAIKVNAIP